MRHPQEIARQEKDMRVIFTLTQAFKGLSSMRIAQIKSQVLQAQDFFNELWHMYAQLRVDSLFRFGRHADETASPKTLYIAITAEGGFSGDIDQRLIRDMLKTYDAAQHDIVIIGHHGAVQLQQAGVSYVKYFKLPMQDRNINVAPLVTMIQGYKNAVAYYQSYESLAEQTIKRLELSKAVQEAGRRAGTAETADIISERTYIFEPSSYAVTAHLERSMLEITLSQVILESKLAQYASRFRAMSAAQERADESYKSLHMAYNRARRAQSDERLKEIINGLKKVQVAR